MVDAIIFTLSFWRAYKGLIAPPAKYGHSRTIDDGFEVGSFVRRDTTTAWMNDAVGAERISLNHPSGWEALYLDTILKATVGLTAGLAQEFRQQEGM